MTEGITLLICKKIIKHYIEDLIFKTLKKKKKNLKKILKVVKITKILFKKCFSTKISKTFDFFGQKSPKKSCHVYLGAFIWNHPDSKAILVFIFLQF